MSTTVCCLQPTYLPYAGVFDMIARSGVFVAFDTPQYEPKSWQSRNRVRGPQGEIMLTVPVKTAGRRFQAIQDVEIADTHWTERHWKTIVQCYRKAPYFSTYATALERVYYAHMTIAGRLVDLNIQLIWALCDMLQISTPILRASDLGVLTTGREQHILGILQAVGSNELLDAAGAEAILDLQPFKEAGVTVRFQHYQHPEYKQVYQPFLPYMSVIDALMCLGPDAKQVILSGGQ
jgi:hypothetical protein